jgi:hypothetical protein
MIPSAKPGNSTVKESDRVDPLMPAPKRQRGLGMRYSTPMPSYLPLGGRDDSITRSIKQRCKTDKDPGSIPPPQLFANPVVPLALSTTPPPSQVPLVLTPFPVNYKHRKYQRRIDRPVTSWPARPGAADHFDNAKSTCTQSPHSPQTGPSLEAANDHPCNYSEVAVATIASIPAAVGTLSLPPAPLINIPAHHPNDANPRLRAVWQLPHHYRYYPTISPMPSSSLTSIRSSVHLDAHPMSEETTGAASPSAIHHHNPTISRP